MDTATVEMEAIEVAIITTIVIAIMVVVIEADGSPLLSVD
jgi:hypothetical protein